MSKKEKTKPTVAPEASEAAEVASTLPAPPALSPQAPALALATPAAASDVTTFRILVEGVPVALKRRVRLY